MDQSRARALTVLAVQWPMRALTMQGDHNFGRSTPAGPGQRPAMTDGSTPTPALQQRRPISAPIGRTVFGPSVRLLFRLSSPRRYTTPWRRVPLAAEHAARSISHTQLPRIRELCSLVPTVFSLRLPAFVASVL